MTTVDVAPQSARLLIRLRAAPRHEPPFDDERDYEPFPSAHQLALAWPASTRTGDAASASHGPAAEPNGPGHQGSIAFLTASGPAGEVAGGAVGRVEGDPMACVAAMGSVARLRGDGERTGAAEPDGDTRARAGGFGDGRLAVRRFVRACVEVLNGYRPAAHLRRLALPAEAARVVAQAIAGAHRVAELRRGDPRRPAHRARRRPAPVAVLHVRICEPRPGAVEASVVLVTGERSWALALRLELHQQSWLATTLRLV